MTARSVFKQILNSLFFHYFETCKINMSNSITNLKLVYDKQFSEHIYIEIKVEVHVGGTCISKIYLPNSPKRRI